MPGAYVRAIEHVPKVVILEQAAAQEHPGKDLAVPVCDMFEVLVHLLASHFAGARRADGRGIQHAADAAELYGAETDLANRIANGEHEE